MVEKMELKSGDVHVVARGIATVADNSAEASQATDDAPAVPPSATEIPTTEAPPATAAAETATPAEAPAPATSETSEAADKAAADKAAADKKQSGGFTGWLKDMFTGEKSGMTLGVLGGIAALLFTGGGGIGAFLIAGVAAIAAFAFGPKLVRGFTGYNLSDDVIKTLDAKQLNTHQQKQAVRAPGEPQLNEKIQQQETDGILNLHALDADNNNILSSTELNDAITAATKGDEEAAKNLKIWLQDQLGSIDEKGLKITEHNQYLVLPKLANPVVAVAP